jgi:hypothetical protein
MRAALSISHVCSQQGQLRDHVVRRFRHSRTVRFWQRQCVVPKTSSKTKSGNQQGPIYGILPDTQCPVGGMETTHA